MTTETRTTIQLSDLKGIEFECVKCHARAMRPVGVWQFPLAVCPECGASWTHYNGTMNVLKNIASQVAKYAEIDDPKNDAPFIVRFELAQPAPKKSL